MCAAATLWSGIDTILYGVSISEALRQGRRRVNLPCREIFERAGKSVTIHEGILRQRCAVLYDREVRDQVEKLRGADENRLRMLAQDLAGRRVAWFKGNCLSLLDTHESLLDTAYRILLKKIGVDANDAPVLERGGEIYSDRLPEFLPYTGSRQDSGSGYGLCVPASYRAPHE